MKKIRFTKMHGAGNDFVLVDDRNGEFPERGNLIAAMAADRMESAGDDFHARLKDGFCRLAAAEPERFALIAADGSVEEVAESVWNSIQPML